MLAARAKVDGLDEQAKSGFNLGGLQPAFHALEAMRAQLANELGPYGIRGVSLQTAGIVDAIPAEFEWAAASSPTSSPAPCSGEPPRSKTSAMSPRSPPPTGPAPSPRRRLNITCGTVVG
jgi:3-oxoacyl-[acyl-carrier protein] reductase